MHAKSPVVQRNPDGVLQSVHILVSALRTGSVTNSLCKHVPGRQAMWNPLSLRSGAGLPAPSLSLFWPESPSLRSWGSLLHVLWGWIFLELLATVTSADSLPWSLSKIFVDTSFLCMTSFNFKNSVFLWKICESYSHGLCKEWKSVTSSEVLPPTAAAVLGETTLSRKDECIRFPSILLSGILPKLGSYYPTLQLYLGLNNIAHTS